MDTVNSAKLSDIIQALDSFSNFGQQDGTLQPDKNAVVVAEAEWRAAIAALTHLLPTLPRSPQTVSGSHQREGIALSGPLPVLNEADFSHRLDTWVVTPQPLAEALQGQRSLMPAMRDHVPLSADRGLQMLPLTVDNPLLAERFCLVMTPTFSVGLVLGQPTGALPCLQYTFDPQVLLSLWRQIQLHVVDSESDRLAALEKRILQVITAPDYRLITQFTQMMMANLPHRLSEAFLMLEDRGRLHFVDYAEAAAEPPRRDHQDNDTFMNGTAGAENVDAELLQAMAHEIRTPLTTIRTLTRSLLRRKDVSAEVKKRLRRIDEECTQQIDRFNLIFRAVELETMERDRPRSSLTPIALTQVFQEAIPRWQQQAQRRNLNLDVTLPPGLPRVNSDPTLLNEVLTGVVEWFTQCLPPQSHVHMRVMLAGHQLKLQFEADPTAVSDAMSNAGAAKRPALKSVGQLLSVVPETGGVSLSLDVTKNLFEFLGGKLILRQKPQQGEVLTAFLPVDVREI